MQLNNRDHHQRTHLCHHNYFSHSTTLFSLPFSLYVRTLRYRFYALLQLTVVIFHHFIQDTTEECNKVGMVPLGILFLFFPGWKARSQQQHKKFLIQHSKRFIHNSDRKRGERVTRRSRTASSSCFPVPLKLILLLEQRNRRNS